MKSLVYCSAGEKLVLHKLRLHPDFVAPFSPPCEGGGLGGVVPARPVTRSSHALFLSVLSHPSREARRIVFDFQGSRITPPTPPSQGGGKGSLSRRHSIARNKNTRLEIVPPTLSTPTFHPPSVLLHLYRMQHLQGSALDDTLSEQHVSTHDSSRRADRVIWAGLGRAPNPPRIFQRSSSSSSPKAKGIACAIAAETRRVPCGRRPRILDHRPLRPNTDRVPQRPPGRGDPTRRNPSDAFTPGLRPSPGQAARGRRSLEGEQGKLTREVECSRTFVWEQAAST